MFSYQSHFKEQYVGTIEKELEDKVNHGLNVPVGCLRLMPCYMKIDDLTLGFPKGPAINVSVFLKRQTEMQIQVQSCALSKTYTLI